MAIAARLARAGMIARESLRVALDGRAFTSPAAGVRRYARQLARALVVRGDVELVALGAREDEVPPGVAVRSARPTLPTNLGWSLTGLPLTALGVRHDVFHAPAYTAPLAGRRPRVVTVHDVSYARVPADYPYKRDPVRRWFYRASARGADLVITDSAFSRDEIAAAYGIDAGRIAVVPLGVGPPFGPPRAQAPREVLPAIGGPFVLHVGDLHPRRRVEWILEAVLRLRSRSVRLASLRLVAAGRDHGVADDLRETARAAGHSGAFVALGVIPEPRLVSLLQQATAFAYASRYEGFGLPLVEAMACGTPVVAVSGASIDEVVGDAGLLVDPSGGPADMADALERVATDASAAAELRVRGLARAAQFTWARTAAETVEVYRRARAERRP